MLGVKVREWTIVMGPSPVSNLVHLRRDTLRVAQDARNQRSRPMQHRLHACVRACGLRMIQRWFQRDMHRSVAQIKVCQRTSGQGVDVHKNAVL